MCIICFPEPNFFDYLRQVLTSDAFEAFSHGSIVDKALLCLGQKQGMLVNHECSSWYSRVGDFFMSVWDKRKQIVYGNGSIGKVRQSMPLHSVRSMALGVMMVEK